MNRDLAKKRGLHLLAAAFAIFYVFVSLFPLLFSLLSSFKNNTTIYAAPFALPEALDLENYRYALGGTSLLRGMANSLLYSVLSIALIILMALLVSYAYRVRVPGYRLVFLFFIAGMALPVHAMLVPLASIINQLKLRDTLAGIVGVYAATNVSLAVFLINGYMKGISRELDEAALMDGAGRFKQAIHVTLPAILPTVAIMLIMAIGSLLSVGYEKIILLYNGSTYETADVISTYVYRKGIQGADYSYSTAVGLFQSVIGLIFIWGANKFSAVLTETSLW